MKSAYSDIKNLPSNQVAGICNIVITPREWLQVDPVVDYDTGKVLTTPILKTNRFWMLLNLAPRSYDYTEAPKVNKSGDYYEIAASGAINTYNYSLRLVLQTLRNSEFVAIVRDRNKRRRIVGNTVAALKLKTAYRQKNSPSGDENLEITLSMDAEDPAPFYNPDNTPEILGNFLIDADGNYLLVQ